MALTTPVYGIDHAIAGEPRVGCVGTATVQFTTPPASLTAGPLSTRLACSRASFRSERRLVP